MSRDVWVEIPRSVFVRRRSPSEVRLKFVRFPSDGILERVRPTTMKNSENGDFIYCQTQRGNYIAWRTEPVPRWVVDIVRQIELDQR